MNAGERLAGDALYTVQGFWLAVAVVVKNGDGIASVEQLHTGVAADVTGSAGDEDVLVHVG